MYNIALLDVGQSRALLNQGWITDHDVKEKVVHGHFTEAMGKGRPRVRAFNWEELGLEVHNLDSLADPITTEEVHEAIKQMPSDKAHDPDGFTGLFLMSCWNIIKEDIMRIVSLFGNLHTTNLTRSTLQKCGPSAQKRRRRGDCRL